MARFAKRLQVDAERAAKRQAIQDEEDAVQAQIEVERKRIVDHVQGMMEEKERGEQISVIAKYAMQSQVAYQSLSMKDVAMSGTYTGPSKYLK